MSTKQRRTRSLEITRKNRKKEQKEAKQVRELLRLDSKKLMKICKQYHIHYVKNKKKETVNKLMKAIQNNKIKQKNKKKRKIKKISLTFSVDDLKEFKQQEQNQQKASNLLIQSTTKEIQSDLTPLHESIPTDEKNSSSSNNNTITSPQLQTQKQIKNEIYCMDNQSTANTENTDVKSNHTKRKSIIDLIARAPKMKYDINNMHGFDTVKDIKDTLPVNVKSSQCKLFYGGKELSDNKTLTQLGIVDASEIKVLFSWRDFKPDTNAPHPKDMEHKHYNKVAELKRLNDFGTFNKLLCGLQRECNINNIVCMLDDKEQMILHEYCICLSGNRTYERKWTKLHSLCYDYQNDIGMVVDLLMKHNIDIMDNNESIYIDAWPHSGYDTPLKMAIQRANPKHIPTDMYEKDMNETDAKAAVELVELLVLNGARRRIGLILTNLERKGNDDHTYPYMDKKIRDKLIDILKPYEEEDPWKPETRLKIE